MHFLIYVKKLIETANQFFPRLFITQLYFFYIGVKIAGK